VVERETRLNDFLDSEISEALRAQMEDMGIRMFMPDTVDTIDDKDMIEVRLRSGTVVQVETILVSAGRCGNTAALALDRIGIDVTERGRIKVNVHYQTSVPHVYAAGDVIGFPALASTSMDQARLAVVHAFDLKYRESLPKILPYGLYTIPECSMAGETGESLKEKNIPFVVGRGAYADNVRGQIIGDSKGFLKLIFQDDDEMKLLGVHLIGEQATELIHIGLMVLQVEKGRDLLMATCFNYPTLAEVYKDATFDAVAGRALRWRGAKAPEPLSGRPSSSPPARG
jgi:NAD(P) transhydrogenase